MTSIEICEVGPRDGLQNHPRHFEVKERVELIDRLSAAGLRRIEAVSFVNDQKVPRMAGAEAVLARIDRPSGALFSGLVLNARGVDRALVCDLQEIRLVVVASETFSRRNQGASTEDTLRVAAGVSEKVRAAGRRFSVVIATAFGCPFEGVVSPARIAAIARRLAALGVDEIVLADTIGAATPFEVASLVPLVHDAVVGIPLGCHFHNTRNLGFANAYAAIGCGVRLLDASIGGLGGCPFAPRATGNVATEDLVNMLAGRLETPVDMTALFATVDWIEQRIGAPAPGLLSRAGIFPPAVGISPPTG
jgi:hydroxymethylglutaryl-CoA lyase